MGYVYRYIDMKDNIIKYIGIVWSENRALLQRVREHQMYDEWCNGKQWKIEYMEIDNKTDCEGLEGHFISLYGTGKWYNKGKKKWGISNVYSMIDWKWKEFDYTSDNMEVKKRNSRRINDSFLSNLYNKSIYIFNNGVCYCFFQTFKKEPIYVYMALSSEDEEFAIENNIRYMNRRQLNFIIEMIEEDNKPFGYGMMPSETEQATIESLNKKECFTYKQQEKLISEILEHEIQTNNLDIEYVENFIRNCVYEMRVDVDYLREQKLKYVFKC